MGDTIRVETFTGKETLEHIPVVARLHNEIFRAFPYLYCRAPEFLEKYLSLFYANSSQCVFVLAYCNDEIVGASTGRALRHPIKSDGLQQLFESHGYDVDSIFYLSDSVLREAYRRRGLGSLFYSNREAYARAKGFETAAFCEVLRPIDHPMCPAEYTPLHDYWERRGYCCRPELQIEFTWQDVADDRPTPKTMRFWLKKLIDC